jgi:prepilin-type N-terminal cleavage/methylation domain-containing protein
VKNQRGFTLIELTVALAVAAVVLGLVIVRIDGWSSRQALSASARALGNTIRLFRERAQAEEETYTLKIQMDRGTYAVTAAGETLRSGRLGVGQTFVKILSGGREQVTPAILQLGPRGILPETKITLDNSAKEQLTITLPSFANEVGYSEPETK